MKISIGLTALIAALVPSLSLLFFLGVELKPEHQEKVVSLPPMIMSTAFALFLMKMVPASSAVLTAAIAEVTMYGGLKVIGWNVRRRKARNRVEAPRTTTASRIRNAGE